MPFTTVRRDSDFVRAVRDIREQPVLAYSLSILAFGLAVLARLALQTDLVPGIPFITFYPAIILATFLGGLGPGVLAMALSALAAWLFFLPPVYGSANGTVIATILVFVVISGTMVALIAFLDDALERIVAREDEVRALIEASPNGVVVVDDAGRVRLLNASAERLFGYQRLELLGQKVEVLVPDRLVNAHEERRKAYMKAPQAHPPGARRDLSARRKDGSEVPVEIELSPLSRDGKHVVIASVVDVSERKRAEEQQRVLVREMSHRTQNLFTIICSIVSSSFSANRPSCETKDALLARLHALARAHAMLADAAWQSAPLEEIVRRELAPFTERADIRGCDIAVDVSAAQNFALIVHELATNATKHGALSVPDGQVTIEGTVERSGLEDVFSFRWRESGGPPAATPMRKGFGSAVLLEFARVFGKHATLNYGPDGIDYELRMRLSAIQGTAPPILPDAPRAEAG